MADEAEIKAKFWKALNKDMTVMLGLAQGEHGHARPMTAQLEEDGFDGDQYRGPVWFFTSTDNALFHQVGGGAKPGIIHFASKGHDVWAAVQGQLSASQDRATIDRLWNRFVAAWYEGKDDPKIALLKFDPSDAEIWIDASSVVAGIKMLIGIDPKQDYKDKVAEVSL
jgi:general stress protein 26